MAKALVSCVKGLFLLFNFVFWITGLTLLVVGILMKFAFSYLMKLSADINYNLAPYIMIGCGVFIILIGFIGCWAAVKEHGWALKLYMGVLVILFIIEIAGAITGYVLRDKLSNGFKTGLSNAVKNYYTDSELREAMDKVQAKVIGCCGVNTYIDYVKNNGTAGNSTKDGVIPKSCCKSGGDKDCNVPSEIYTKGCYDELVSKTKDKFKIIGGVALGIAVFQLLGIICGYILIKQFNETSYETMA